MFFPAKSIFCFRNSNFFVKYNRYILYLKRNVKNWFNCTVFYFLIFNHFQRLRISRIFCIEVYNMEIRIHQDILEAQHNMQVYFWVLQIYKLNILVNIQISSKYYLLSLFLQGNNIQVELVNRKLFVSRLCHSCVK